MLAGFAMTFKHTLTYDSSGELTLFPVRKNEKAGPLEYTCDAEGSLLLPGAHGEEIVRDLFTDMHVRI